jgi:alpha-amylase
MVSVCFYFQVHQPLRLRNYTIFEINNNHDYFDHSKNRDIMKKVATKCYLPANKLILDLVKKTNGKFRVSYSISGVALEQLEEYAPEVIETFRELADTGAVEFLSETYYHSLSFLYSKEEFKQQIEMHRNKIKELFDYSPTVFRNTELIYNNELGNFVEKLGYKGILAEGADHVLGWRSPNFLYKPLGSKSIKLLLKNYKLSDDIAFRFSEKSWKEHPLTVEKFAQWVSAINGNGNIVNLFMDYETFGEHQWAQSGIFRFLKYLPHEILKHPDNDFVTVSEAIDKFEPVAELDIHNAISWADVERDLSAWLGNKMQQEAIKQLYMIENGIKTSNDEKLLNDWRRLQTSDHFYYMCTKWFADGDVHKYFNPYDSPYDGFITFINVLNDLVNRMKQKSSETPAFSNGFSGNRNIYNGVANI